MAAPLQNLPPGVYFNPSPEECVRDFLKPWKEGIRPAAGGRVIYDADIYSGSPDALLRGREPGLSRGFQHKWLLLTRCVRQGRGRPRAKRGVATGGCWKAEQKSRRIGNAEETEEAAAAAGGDLHVPGGRRRTFGFYLGEGRGKDKASSIKTPWLMEEIITEEDDAAGGDRVVPVFCKVYVSPRASDDEKREIFGEDGVPLDRDGNTKPVRVEVTEELFDAVAARFPGHQQGQAAAPPAVLGGHHGQAVLPARAPRHQHGQAAAPPAVPGGHHGQAAPRPGFPCCQCQCGHAMPLQFQGRPDQHYGMAVQQQPWHVLDPSSIQEASPGVGGYYNRHPAPPPIVLDSQLGEEMIHMEKKPRLTYGSPTPQPQGVGGTMPVCVFQVDTYQEQRVLMKLPDDDGCGDTNADAKVLQEAEPVPTPPPLQKFQGTVTCATAPPAPELAQDACQGSQATAESMSEGDIFVDLADLTQESFVDNAPDFGVHSVFFPPALGFDVSSNNCRSLMFGGSGLPAGGGGING